MADGLSALTPTQKFNRDMVYGEELEQRLLTAFEWSFPHMMWTKHENCSGKTDYHCKCFDLEDLATQRTIECKRDWRSMETGNFCFETYLADPDVCKADYLVHEASPEALYIFDMAIFRRWVPQFSDPIMVGDGKRVQAWIISKQAFLQNIPHKRVFLDKPLTMDMFR